MVWVFWHFFWYLLALCCHLLVPAQLCSQCSVSLCVPVLHLCPISHISCISAHLFQVSLHLHLSPSLVWFVFKPVLFLHFLSVRLVFVLLCSCACSRSLVLLCSQCSWFVPFGFLVCPLVWLLNKLTFCFQPSRPRVSCVWALLFKLRHDTRPACHEHAPWA